MFSAEMEGNKIPTVITSGKSQAPQNPSQNSTPVIQQLRQERISPSPNPNAHKRELSMWDQMHIELHNMTCLTKDLAERLLQFISQDVDSPLKFQKICAIEEENQRYINKITQIVKSAALMTHSQPHPIFIDISNVHRFTLMLQASIEAEKNRLQQLAGRHQAPASNAN